MTLTPGVRQTDGAQARRASTAARLRPRAALTPDGAGRAPALARRTRPYTAGTPSSARHTLAGAAPAPETPVEGMTQGQARAPGTRAAARNSPDGNTTEHRLQAGAQCGIKNNPRRGEGGAERGHTLELGARRGQSAEAGRVRLRTPWPVTHA